MTIHSIDDVDPADLTADRIEIIALVHGLIESGDERMAKATAPFPEGDVSEWLREACRVADVVAVAHDAANDPATRSAVGCAMRSLFRKRMTAAVCCHPDVLEFIGMSRTHRNGTRT